MGKMIIVKGLKTISGTPKSLEVVDGYYAPGGNLLPSGSNLSSGGISKGWYCVRFPVVPGEILRFSSIAGERRFGGEQVHYYMFAGTNYTNMIGHDYLCPDQTFTVPSGVQFMAMNIAMQGSVPAVGNPVKNFTTVPTLANTRIVALQQS